MEALAQGRARRVETPRAEQTLRRLPEDTEHGRACGGDRGGVAVEDGMLDPDELEDLEGVQAQADPLPPPPLPPHHAAQNRVSDAGGSNQAAAAHQAAAAQQAAAFNQAPAVNQAPAGLSPGVSLGMVDPFVRDVDVLQDNPFDDGIEENPFDDGIELQEQLWAQGGGLQLQHANPLIRPSPARPQLPQLTPTSTPTWRRIWRS
ncbi:MAG: hypothetical protein WDW36_008728 [Sanguina aurantia]